MVLHNALNVWPGYEVIDSSLQLIGYLLKSRIVWRKDGSWECTIQNLICWYRQHIVSYPGKPTSHVGAFPQ